MKKPTITNSPNSTSTKNSDNMDSTFNFGGWETEEAKLRHNLTLTHVQIMNWLEEANKFNKEIRKKSRVIR